MSPTCNTSQNNLKVHKQSCCLSKQRKFMRGLFTFTAVALVIFGAFRLYYNLTDDFHLGNITYPMTYREEWDFPLTAEKKEQLAAILNQKFYYLGKGAQVYAFESADGQYVIKFFKFKHLKPSVVIAALPSVWPFADIKKHNVARKMRKIEGVFQGHALAYRHDLEHSGLIYVRLNPKGPLNLHVDLVDKIGIERRLDLDPVVFVVQKKGRTLREVFTELLDAGNSKLAITRAEQILAMYVEEYKKGVWDRDHGISHNTGFIGDQPFHLDVGKFSYDVKMQAPSFYEQDLKHVAAKMEMWIKDNYPAYYPAFHQDLMAYTAELLARSAVSTPMPELQKSSAG